MSKHITITIAGTSGSGKTGTALEIAKLLMSKGAGVTIEDQDGVDAAVAAMVDHRFDTYVEDLSVTIKTVSELRASHADGGSI